MIRKSTMNWIGAIVFCQLFSIISFGQCEDFEGDVTVIDPFCYGDSTGTISVETTGGTGENSYSISPDIFSINGAGVAENLPAGEYTISVIDEADCELELVVNIYQPDELFLSEFGFEPAYCRTSGGQDPDGVVFGAGNGGTPDYEYEWTFLETGETSNNSTWGGREPGAYQFKCTDDNGCILISNITLDSLNPHADFDLISDDVWEIPYGYAGNAPVNIVCENTSTGGNNPFDPSSDTAKYKWHMHNYATWISSGYNFEPSITYEFENLWGIKLAMESGNGCLDTAHQFIAVFGPVSLDESQESQTVRIVPNNINKSVKIQKSGFSSGIQVKLYSASGKLLFEKSMVNDEEDIPFNMVKGVYLYEFIDLENSERIGSGKFVY